MTRILNLLLVLVLLTYAFPSSARQLAKVQLIGRPQKSSTKIVGARDASGRFRAAVQAVSNMDGFRHNSHTGSVEVDDRHGRHTIYPPSDERALEIFEGGYKSFKLILSEIGSQLRPKGAEKVRQAQKPHALPVSILVKPDGARVLIDGKDMGTGPTFQLAKGSHRLRIVKSDYETLEQTIHVDEKNLLFNFTLRQKENVGVQIESNPVGAKVFLDGAQFGETPVSGFYPQGNYAIKIEKAGYVSFEETILVAPPLTRKYYLLEENVGYLTVNAPARATVYLNGQVVSERQNIKLAPMVARLRVTLAKAEALEKQVTIKRDDRMTIDLFPRVPTGSIQVAVTPFDAKVELKGDADEYFTSQGMKIFKNIPIGRYQLSVSQAGYTEYKEPLTLTVGATISRNIKLDKLTTARAGTDLRNMVFVQGGAFQMGSTSGDSDEKPVHSVTVNSFYMSKYEVTQKEWRAVMGRNPSRFKGDALPVEKMSWYEAVAFCNKKSLLTGLTPAYKITGKDVSCDFSAKGYRLPTEAEWEYAARNGAKSRGYQYSGSNNLDQVGWYLDNSGKKTHPVGQKQANELGVYDLSGNVWEWCWDWYDSGYYKKSPRTNPKGPDSGNQRVLRGGSWLFDSSNVRCANRNGSNPDLTYINFGFRYVHNVFENVAVQIESTPVGAQVFLDSLQFGETPLSGFYPNGSYTIKLEKAGYVSLEETLQVAPPLTRKSYRLEENVGYLTVNTHANATVYLNGKVTHDRQDIKLAPMVASLKVTLPKAAAFEKMVTIKLNDRVTVDLYPRAQTGTVQVRVTPFDAKVELKGDAGEYFTAQGMNDFKDIPIGSYKLSVHKHGYSAHDETIELANGGKISRSVKLEKVVLVTNLDLPDTPPTPPEDDDGMNVFVPFDEPPSPKGGFGAIQRALEYPEIARRAGVEGRVVVQILVSEKGEVVNTRVIKSIGHRGCDEAAVKAIKSVKWKPALQRDKPVRVWVAIPVLFKKH